MRILVTGGSGFIGSHLVDKAIEAGHEVSILDVKRPHREDAEFTQGSILSLRDINKSIKACNIVFHIAAFSNIDLVKDNPLKTVKLNIMGTANVLEASRLHSIERFILASSVYIYEDRGHIYTTAKFTSERLCQDYFSLYGLPYTILRYGTVYGPRSREADVISIFVQRALAGKDLIIRGGGNQKRNFIYTDDLAEGNIAALKKIAENQNYALVNRRSVSIKDVAATIRKVVNPEINIIYDGRREDDYQGKTLDSDKAEKELGWSPRVSLEEGIKKFAEWYRNKQV